jgi:CHASE3 domain sensor protein
MPDTSSPSASGVDPLGKPIIDPTKNVLDLVEAAVKRLNDLASAESKRLDEKIAHVHDLLVEKDKHYEQRFSDTKIAVDAALIAADKAVAAQLAGQKEAVTKAETAAEKRFESVNEFRNTLSDQQRTLMPRAEAEVKFEVNNKLMDAILARLDKTEGKGAGLSQSWGVLVGAVGLIGSLIAIVYTVLNS